MRLGNAVGVVADRMVGRSPIISLSTRNSLKLQRVCEELERCNGSVDAGSQAITERRTSSNLGDETMMTGLFPT